MTREEALQILDTIPTIGEQVDALEMAIKALSQEPTKEEQALLQKWRDNRGISIEEFEDAMNALQEPCDDAISRDWLKTAIHNFYDGLKHTPSEEDIQAYIDAAPSVTQKSGKWIPVSEKLPEDTYPVNITWVNHDPEPYYADIKDKPFTATGCYCDGKWYWYSVTCQDYLDEYRYCDVDSMDEAIEVIAWMPLPKPFEPRESEDKE